MNRFDSLFALTSATFIGVLTFLYLPIAIYSANPTEFQSATLMVVPWLLLGTTVAIGLLWVPCLILKGIWQQRYCYALGAIAIVSWISGVFLSTISVCSMVRALTSISREKRSSGKAWYSA